MFKSLLLDNIINKMLDMGINNNRWIRAEMVDFNNKILIITTQTLFINPKQIITMTHQ